MNLDDQKIDIPCPNCKKKLPIAIGQLKRINEVTCTGCSTKIHLDKSQFTSEIAKIDKSLKDLMRTLSKFGK